MDANLKMKINCRLSGNNKKYLVLPGLLVLVASCTIVSVLSARTTQTNRRVYPQTIAQQLKSGNHTENYAVIVSTSRYYHNYRHATNALSIYDVIRNQGNIPDTNIILMLADDIPCNARNPIPNTIFGDSASNGPNLYPSDIQVDYRGNDVTVANFLRVLTGRHLPGTPANRKLPTHDNANVLIFLTGHGGNQFFKFQDVEEISSSELAQTFQHMHSLGRYNEMLFIADTCQAFTLSEGITAPNVISIGSSLKDENSFAHHTDQVLGAAVIDRFTHVFTTFTASLSWHQRSIKDWIDTSVYSKLYSNVGVTDATSRRKIHEIPMADFFVMKRLSKQMKSWKMNAETARIPLYNFWDTKGHNDEEKRNKTEQCEATPAGGDHPHDYSVVANNILARITNQICDSPWACHQDSDREGNDIAFVFLGCLLFGILAAAFLVYMLVIDGAKDDGRTAFQEMLPSPVADG